ncbi:MAG TPA: hypothetical protein VI818_01130, partial [Candidatus Thermoplasmatota archaeon]|nr:hypothetical protein [Candidatus Thermoplasmatota archaeon]
MLRKLVVPLVLLLALSVFPLVTTEAQSVNDGSGAGDAGNSQNQASSLAQGHWSGQLGPSDPADWFEFDIPSISSSNGRPRIEILFRTDGAAVQRVDLFGFGDPVGEPGKDGDEPTATGKGTRAQGIVYQADRDSSWHIRVTGQEGRYEFEFRFPFENDANRGRDAPNHEGINNEIRLTGDFGNGVIVHGNFTAGETTDVYRFNVPVDDARLHAYLQFAPTARLDVELTDP